MRVSEGAVLTKQQLSTKAAGDGDGSSSWNTSTNYECTCYFISSTNPLDSNLFLFATNTVLCCQPAVPLRC